MHPAAVPESPIGPPPGSLCGALPVPVCERKRVDCPKSPLGWSFQSMELN